MAHGRRFLGQVVLVLAVMAAAFVGARLGLLGTRDARASHNFNDVPPGAFYHDAVDFLAANGITSGCGAGLFCPENPATRGQIAVFLERLNDFQDARTLWAVVSSTGILERGVHVTSASRLSMGTYAVVFDRDVSNCAFAATIGGDTAVFAGEINAGRLINNPNGVRVTAFHSSGAATGDRPFHLAVHC